LIGLEFGQSEGPTKGHVLNLKGADVPDGIPIVHLRQALYAGKKPDNARDF
jgi:hypothetical protein